MPQIPDADVDAITFQPDPGKLRISGSPDDVLAAFIGPQSWRASLRYWLRALAINSGGEFHKLGFALDTDQQNADDPPFTGVRVFTPRRDEVLISRACFDRLMARFYTAVLATATRDPVTDEAWWPDFEAQARALSA